MGFLWDLMQQSQIQQHGDRAASTEQRVIQLEAEVARLSALVRELIVRLETKLDSDLDGNGRVG